MSVAARDKFEEDSNDIEEYMIQMGELAHSAAGVLAYADPELKNSALLAIAGALDTQRDIIQVENDKDMQIGKTNGLEEALLDRLLISDKVTNAMIDGLQQVAALTDPIGEITDLAYRPSGIQVGKMRVPLGVIGIIYESRPNVTIDAAALCLKSGNASILRGGKEAIHSNRAIYRCIKQGLEEVGLPPGSVQVVNSASREAVAHMLKMDSTIDVIIPRGGKSLIDRVTRESSIPVIKHLHGVCHVYIDSDADLEKATAIAVNAKTRRYGVCNAMETLLISDSIAADIMPELINRYLEHGVELRGCQRSHDRYSENILLASDEDWETEYLAPILSIKIVDDMEQAINHIYRYGSGHTDSIVTENYSRARQFLRRVDSSSVMVNASTSFADGFEYGLGAEIGISTNKLHARGPVGLTGLTSEKYIVLGDGHIRN